MNYTKESMTLKEYNELLENLQKENFDLKLRLYMMSNTRSEIESNKIQIDFDNLFDKYTKLQVSYNNLLGKYSKLIEERMKISKTINSFSDQSQSDDEVILEKNLSPLPRKNSFVRKRWDRSQNLKRQKNVNRHHTDIINVGYLDSGSDDKLAYPNNHLNEKTGNSKNGVHTINKSPTKSISQNNILEATRHITLNEIPIDVGSVPPEYLIPTKSSNSQEKRASKPSNLKTLISCISSPKETFNYYKKNGSHI